MKTKLNRILSLLLSIALIISLLPVMPAFAAGEEQKLALSDFYAYTSTVSSKGIYEYTSAVLSWTSIQVRRYGSGGGGVDSNNGNTQHGAIKVTVNVPGEYNLYFKTDNPTETSVAPLVAMGKYDKKVSGAVAPNQLTGEKTTLGYFNFSKAPKGEYAPVTADGSADGTKQTITLEKGDYYILFVADPTSLALNNKGRNENPDDPVYGTVMETEASSAYYWYRQEMYLSGIRIVPVGQEVSEDEVVRLPESIEASFAEDLLTAGKQYPLTITDGDGKELSSGIKLAYKIENEKILSQKNGVFTPLAPGRTTVTATATLGNDSISAKCEVNIIGKNLLVTTYNHGEFERDVYLGDSSNSVGKKDTFWKSSKNTSTYVYDYELLKGIVSEITGETTNIPKFSMKPTGDLNRIRLQGNVAYSTKASDQRTLLVGGAGKLYEMTGYIKSENTNTLPVADIRMYYYNELSSSAVSLKNMATQLWAEKSGDQPWTKFTTPSLYLNYGYNTHYGIEPRLNFIATECKGADISVAHLSVHEVAFDRAELSLSGETKDLQCGDTVKTVLSLYSNTGNPITIGAALGDGEIKYTSSDDGIATVDNNGVITVVSNGDAEITATVTIGGETRDAPVSVSFGDVKPVINRAEVTADKTELTRGETAKITEYKLFCNDGEEYTGESSVYWYESSDVAVATVSQDGIITARGPGNADIAVWVEADGVQIKGTLHIAVADDTPFEYAAIIGADNVEVDFSTALTVRAWHESGNEADLENADRYTVTYALANPEDEQYLVLDPDTGVITGISACESVNVVATVTCGEYSKKSEPFSVKVTPKSPKSKLIDFRKPGSGFASNVTIEQYGWEINTDKTANMCITPNNPDLRCYAQGVQIKTETIGNTRNADLAIDIQVDYDGWYELDFLGTQYYRGANRTNLYMDGKFLGDFCFWTDMSTNRNYNALKSLNTIYLTEGVHTFTMRAMETDSTGSYSYMIPAYLQLSYVEGEGGVEKIELSAEKASLAAGESTSLTPGVVMAGGRSYVFGAKHGDKETVKDAENNLTLESSDDSIVKISGEKLVAVAPGTATITATANVKGAAAVSKSIEITVNEQTLDRIEFTEPQYDIFVSGSVSPVVKAYLTNGSEIKAEDISVEFEVADTEIAVSTEEKITGVKAASTTVRARVTFGGATYYSDYIPLNVLSEGFASLELTSATQVLKKSSEGIKLSVCAYDNNGAALTVPDGALSYVSSDESVVTVDEKGFVTPVDTGVAEIEATVTIDGVSRSESIIISVRDGKTDQTYYTEKKVNAARENIKLYDWAEDTAEAAIEEADKYLPHYDFIYNMITAHTLPRAYDLVETDDPLIWRCFYCGVDINYKYGKYGWKIDAIARPWKIQCPDCKRLFPSNDFGEYYKRGLDEHGEFDYTLAREANGILCGRGERNEKGEYVVFDWAKDNPYGYGDPKGNLYNETYSELHAADAVDPFYKDKITQGWGDFKTGGDSGVPTTGYFWGVDDGFGYDTGRYNTSSEDTEIRNVHRYVAIFNHDGVWYGSGSIKALVRSSLNAFRDAYLYTGDKKYGIAGAIILDRVADLYPDMDYGTDCPKLQSSHDGGGNGKVVGRIWENTMNSTLTISYDAFFDVYDDPEVVGYLSGKAEQWNLDNKKTNGELIRQNAEENLLFETYTAIKNGQIAGNFGMKQQSLALAAVILDREPDTSEMIEFIMQPGVTSQTKCTGGGMRPALFNKIDRDGYADESSMGYMKLWVSTFSVYMEAIENWDGLRDEDNLYKNPKFIKMLYMGIDQYLAGVRSANIGDNSSTFAGVSFPNYTTSWLEGLRLTGDPVFAQLLWHTNGQSADGIHYGIFVEDPESPQEQIKQLVEQYDEYNFSESSITTGYGFAALRDGVMYDKVTTPTQTNTMRDWWMYFGGAATTHKHQDALNLGLDAFGLNMAPDLGYFSSSGGTGTTQGANWTESTISHNTVLVNDTPQVRIQQAGYPYHFEDAGSIKIMDVDAPQAYPGVTETYRRTVVSIDVDDTVSYALDFFRIVGGDEHVYSFHSQSEESVVTGVDMIAQPQGSYAGVDVPFGEETKYTATNGFNWLANVKRAVAPQTGEFSIDFKITDYRKVLKGKRNLHLKLTQLNDFNISEVATADGQPVQHDVNPEFTDYLLVRRSGKDLDTLFTSVIEPYEDESKIRSLTRVPVTYADGSELGRNETVTSIKVELTNGRVDYVVYAANNETAYRIDNLFDFEGFVGVYSVNATDNTDVVRTYLHDGKTLGAAIQNKDSAVTGEIVSFTDTLSLENFMEVTYNEEIAPEELVGRMIVIENDGSQNGAYMIKSAEKEGDHLRIGTGDVSYFRSLTADGNDYVMNIAKGDTYRIPLTYVTDNAPEIDVSGTFTTSAGSSIKIPLNVTSDREYTLIGTSLPRGMSLNAETGVLTWKPDASQVGENHVAVTVDNGVLSDTVHFIVTVYGNTTGGSTSDKTETSGADNTGTTGTPPASGGSGGGGGAAPTDKPDGTANPGETDTSGESGENTDNTGTENNSLRFTDLDDHAWAADEINALAADGIIKGTTASTFSPASNITRADFALLLVRAFKLESENTENFVDVSANDYFATELAIARNTGIINGIGDNKFAPRNTITRQDMMVIVYRALEAYLTLKGSEAERNVGAAMNDSPVDYQNRDVTEPGEMGPSNDGGGISPSLYPDFANVADYAKTAVSALVGAGLVNGKNGRIAPTDYTTRAEVAVLLKRILDYVK